MADFRHKRVKQRSLAHRVAVVAAPLVTVAAVAGGVAIASSPAPASLEATGSPLASLSTIAEQGREVRAEALSRSAERASLAQERATDRAARRAERRAERQRLAERAEERAARAAAREAAREARREARVTEAEIVGTRFVTVPLNVWTGPGEDNTLLTVLEPGTEVSITGREHLVWAEIAYEGKSRWVTAEYLVEEEAAAIESRTGGGLSTAACASGSDVESGLGSNAVAVHRAVCAEYPEVSSYGGLGGDGEHAQGRALDIMVSGSLGDSIAEYVRANADALGVSEVIWAQQIWTVERSSEGWRYMEDRGSTTANHYDHVHVTTY